MKNLSRKQKVALIVCAVILLSSGTVGTVFGVKKHRAKKVAAPIAE